MMTTPFISSLPSPPYVATIPGMLGHIATAFDDATALANARESVSFAELEPKSTAIALGLLRAGATKGSRIGLLMSNTIEWVLSFLAITRIGAIAVPLSTFYQAREMAWVIRHADLQILICEDRFLGHDYIARLEEALPQLASSTGPLALASAPFLRHIFVKGEARRSWTRPWLELVDPPRGGDPDYLSLVAAVGAEVSPADIAVIIYTSGSTADPKGVTHTHGKLTRHTFGLANVAWPFAAGDRIATTRPFFWISGLAATIMYGLNAGACLVCRPAQTPRDIIDLVQENDLTGLVGREPWLLALQGAAELRTTPFSVLSIGYGCSAIARTAAHLTRFVSGRIEAQFPAGNGPLPAGRAARSIGMTETIGSETQEKPFLPLPDGREWSCGRRVPGMTFKIIDPETERSLPHNEVGELCIRDGPLTDGFYKKERSHTFDADGFYHTGDLCRIDEAGFVFFVARRTEMIKVRGANVAPEEVERCLTETGHVAEAAVVNVQIDGEDAVAAAVIRAAASTIGEYELIQILKGQLSSFKVPRRVLFFEEGDLPRTGSAKLKKPEIQALLARELAAVATSKLGAV